jgi:hypothetical protein
MKNPDDLKTLELSGVDVLKRGRGRPVSPNSMTNAQRQAARRARLAASGERSFTVTLPADVVKALDKFMLFKGETQSEVVSRLLRDRLCRPR